VIQWTATRTEVQTAWRPPADVYETPTRVSVTIELAGIEPAEVAVLFFDQAIVVEGWAQGIALARERFLEALRQVGVECIGHEGERFDPSVHEAVIYQEQPGAGDQHVQSVLRPGYRLGPQLLRPAQVVVVGPPRNASEGGTPTWPK